MTVVRHLGLTDYDSTLSLQRGAFDALLASKRGGPSAPEIIFTTEHRPVYTLGRHGHESNLLVSADRLESEHAAVYRTDRGGDITFHGPGQLVVYPVIDLEPRRMGVKDYVWALEQTVIDTVARYGIEASRLDGAPGVWLEPDTLRARKICALGVRCSRYVTMHGFALNVNTDLRWFSQINPCGFTDKGVTSISLETGRQIDMSEVASAAVDILLRRLGQI